MQDPSLRNKQPVPAAYNRYDQERFKGKEGDSALWFPLHVLQISFHLLYESHHHTDVAL